MFAKTKRSEELSVVVPPLPPEQEMLQKAAEYKAIDDANTAATAQFDALSDRAFVALVRKTQREFPVLRRDADWVRAVDREVKFRSLLKGLQDSND